MVRRRRDKAALENRLDLGREDEPLAAFHARGDTAPVKRFLPHAVAREKQSPPPGVPEREGEHAAEPQHAVVAPLLVGVHDGLRVGARAVFVAGRFEPLPVDAAALGPAVEPPWRIGWFGALRCSRSLQLLGDFSRRAGGRFETVLRGRPALSEFADFHAAVDAAPSLSFEGPYRNPEDVEAIYREVHFSWVIDFFEEGLNSSWLLPNRLYEGCRHGAIPIAMEGTETARFLQRHGIGLLLPEPSEAALAALLGSMSAASFVEQRKRIAAKPDRVWSSGREDCRALVARLKNLSGAGIVDAFLEAPA